MKLLIALGSAAVMTAACAASATVSGSNVGAVQTVNTVHAGAAANSGSDVPGDLDVNRVNPLPGKTGGRPVIPVQPHVVATQAPAPPAGIPQDRCGGGIGNPQGSGNRNAPVTAGKHPQLPACNPA